MGIYLPFKKERQRQLSRQSKDLNLKQISLNFIIDSAKYDYGYNFTWLGRPIIQFPQDILAFQEIIWMVKPKIIIETGIAHGGSIIFSASMMHLLGNKGQVVGIDIDIRDYNRKEIENHPMFKYITMLEGSSTDPKILKRLKNIIKNSEPVLVILDSNHTENHVLKELNLYSGFVTIGSYIIVLDTIVEDMPTGFFKNKSWNIGNNPKTAVRKFLSLNHNFKPDFQIDNKLLISTAPSGYLKRIK
jgi:cephalosporin hydroxylase